ncbi:OST3/OST6 family protein [Toxoplasma gondii RUB]|uniref:OST3/OST6 family protein n=3 Tax=Toxoplasma gondii TaxID=5811 RepID=A0A2G8XS36_TOXGO|nr:OST3/OST6 family protein [Toxoplasma gondii RUB]KFH03420.1 OST3/OST6 family protein [Toxoplasma gondii VAND]PIL97850.1 OST3/OST6 family protein [Toxoplasma gondii COUG]
MKGASRYACSRLRRGSEGWSPTGSDRREKGGATFERRPFACLETCGKRLRRNHDSKKRKFPSRTCSASAVILNRSSGFIGSFSGNTSVSMAESPLHSSTHLGRYRHTTSFFSRVRPMDHSSASPCRVLASSLLLLTSRLTSEWTGSLCCCRLLSCGSLASRSFAFLCLVLYLADLFLGVPAAAPHVYPGIAASSAPDVPVSSSSASLQRLEELLLRAQASPSFLVSLDEEAYNALLLSSLPTVSADGGWRRRRAVRAAALFRRQIPHRPYHVFVLYSLVGDSERHARCNECRDALDAFTRVSEAYWSAGAPVATQPQQKSANSAFPPPSVAPVVFAVVDVARLNQTPALHALPSLPAVAHIPPSLLPGEEVTEDEEEEDDFNPEDQWAKMIANAPLPFPRDEVLVLQRAINDAGVKKNMLEWVNMKTKRNVTIPTTVWMDAKFLCLILAFLCSLLFLGRRLLQLLPQYPWLLSGGACFVYWLSTSGLVFSVHNRVPLFAVHPETQQKIFVTPNSRGQYFLEGFVMSACVTACGLAAAFLVFLPSSFFPTRQELAGEAGTPDCETGKKGSVQALARPPRLCPIDEEDSGNRSTSFDVELEAGESHGRGDVSSGTLREASCSGEQNSSGVSGARKSKDTRNGGKAVSDGERHGTDEAILHWIDAEHSLNRDQGEGLNLWATRVCMLICLLMTAFAFVASASLVFQVYRQKAPWYTVPFFPPPEYKRGPMRADRGNEL